MRYRKKETNKRQKLTDSNEEMPTQRRSQGGKQWDIVSQSALKKGGVGKTVTVCNLAALMAQDGKRVLVVDMDAQGNCTYTLTGARVTDNTFDRAGVYDMFRAYGISGTQNYISRTQFDNIDIIPANGNTPMAAKQLQILEQSESTSINMFLAMCLAQVAGEYDFILIDTPPSRDVMVTNALMASDFVLIPACAMTTAVTVCTALWPCASSWSTMRAKKLMFWALS